MADLEDDSILRTANLTLNGADLRVASSLKEGAYRISRRIFRGSTYYLTRHDMDVEASLLNEKSNAQIWSIKPHIEIVGLYTITSFEDPDLCLTYDTSSNIIVDGISQYWNLDVRGSQFVIGDFTNEKAINLDKNSKLDMKPRSDSLNLSDHSQRWTFTIAKGGDNGGDLPSGLEDWRETTLESGLYFVMNQTNSWFQWSQSTSPTGTLTTYPMISNLPKSNGAYFMAGAFVFSRNDDGSYHITNWHHLSQVPHERYLQVSNGRPVLAESRSKCHLYRGKGSDSYVIAISDSDRRDPSLIVFDPPTANNGEKAMTIKTLHEVSTGGVLWRMTKVPPG